MRTVRIDTLSETKRIIRYPEVNYHANQTYF